MANSCCDRLGITPPRLLDVAKRYRRETFCYGPNNCPLHAAGPCRRVPGRKGAWTEEDRVDEDATGHSGEGD